MASSQKTADGIVALFNASDDAIDMIQALLREANDAQSLVWCHFADLKNGVVDFQKYLSKHNPEVVIFDISPPYDENWQFFKTMRDSDVMRGRGLVLTTTNKNRLDEVLGTDSHALEVVGKPEDMKQIQVAVCKGVAEMLVRNVNFRYAARPEERGALRDESEPGRHGSAILPIGGRVANGRDARPVVRQTFPQSIRFALKRGDARAHGRVVR